MKMRSLQYRTDLLFIEYEGTVIDRGDYLVALTPANPSAHWGNFLLFPQPPGPGDYERWTRIFRDEIGRPFGAAHYAFAWDDTQGDAGAIEPFLANGFFINRSVTLQLRTPPHPPQRAADAGLEIRPLSTNEDWEAVLRNQVLCRPERYEEEGYTRYKRRQMSKYRRMQEAGLGSWFGGFDGKRMVADLGLYYSRDERWGRFQKVETLPSHRNRGIASAMVRFASLLAFETWNLESLVIVAEKDHQAQNIYKAIGFEAIEESVSVDRT